MFFHVFLVVLSRRLSSESVSHIGCQTLSPKATWWFSQLGSFHCITRCEKPKDFKVKVLTKEWNFKIISFSLNCTNHHIYAVSFSGENLLFFLQGLLFDWFLTQGFCVILAVLDLILSPGCLPLLPSAGIKRVCCHCSATGMKVVSNCYSKIFKTIREKEHQFHATKYF